MSDFMIIVWPLLKRVKEIEESLCKHNKDVVNGELIEYGKFEKEFKLFKLKELREKNKKITEKDFLKSLQKELSDIKDFFLEKERDGIISSDVLLSKIEKCEQNIKVELGKLKSPLTKKNIKSNSFGWYPKNDREIGRLYDELRAFFIDINKEVFLGIFSNPINPPNEPILWLKEIQDLVYLFQQLANKNLIRKEGIHSLIDGYRLFRTTKNEHLTRNNLDTALNRLNRINPPKSKHAEVIDKILLTILKIREKKT